MWLRFCFFSPDGRVLISRQAPLPGLSKQLLIELVYFKPSRGASEKKRTSSLMEEAFFNRPSS